MEGAANPSWSSLRTSTVLQERESPNKMTQSCSMILHDLSVLTSGVDNGCSRRRQEASSVMSDVEGNGTCWKD
jgi:hypothetical protein